MNKKKLDLGGRDLPHGIVLRRRPSYIGRENPEPLHPPVHGVCRLVS